MISAIWTIITAFLFLIFFISAALYFHARSKGKSHLAVSATSTIAAIWAGYVSLLSVNWLVVLLAWAIRSSPSDVVKAAAPSIITVVGGAPIAALLSYLIYRLGAAALKNDTLPLNASARELEEPGRHVIMFELTGAHLRYKISGRTDRPFRDPGADPYSLPQLQRSIDWSTLAADLLVQFEPNLIRESFRYLFERQLFTLDFTNPLIIGENKTWIIRAIEDFSDSDSFEIFDSFFMESGASINSACCVVCGRSSDVIDQSLISPAGVRIRILSEAALLNGLLDLNAYALALVRRFSQRTVPGTSYSLEDCFVTPKVCQVSAASSSKLSDLDVGERDLLPLIEEWSCQAGVNHISIIGEFGQGKSTAVLAFCFDWAKRWLSGNHSGYIPLLIELRGKSPRRQAPDRFLAEWGDRYGLRGDALFSL